MRLTSRRFIFVLCVGEAISPAHLVGLHGLGYEEKFDNLNSSLAKMRAFEEGRPLGLSQSYTGIQFSYCLRADSTSLSEWRLPLPVTASRGSTTMGTVRLSTFITHIRSLQKRLETAAKLSVALCIAFRTAVGNSSWFRVDSVELRRRIIDGVVVAFIVSIVSSIASHYIVNKIQGQAVNSCTFVVDPDVMKKLLQADNGLRSDKSKEKK